MFHRDASGVPVNLVTLAPLHLHKYRPRLGHLLQSPRSWLYLRRRQTTLKLKIGIYSRMAAKPEPIDHARLRPAWREDRCG